MGGLKILGRVLVAMLALSAFAVDTASAQEVAIRSDGPVTLSATETGEASANGFTMFGETIRCPGSTYTGHKTGSSELIPNGATAATITPAYKQTSTTANTYRKTCRPQSTRTAATTSSTSAKKPPNTNTR